MTTGERLSARVMHTLGRISGRTMMNLVALVLILVCVPLLRAQSSTSYRLKGTAVNNGGSPEDGVTPASANYELEPASIGDTIAGSANSASYELKTGFAGRNPATGPEIFTDGFATGTTSQWSSSVGK